MLKSLEEVRAEGRAQGRTEGRTEGQREVVLIVLDARGIPVPDTARERILIETDPDLLKHWLEKACVASSIEGVFVDL
jgi:hypothetical protein